MEKETKTTKSIAGLTELRDNETPKDTYNAAIGWLESCGDKKCLDYKKITSLVNQYYLSVKVKEELATALDVLGVPHT